MKRIAILLVGLASMGAGCWSASSVRPVAAPSPAAPVVEQPVTPPPAPEVAPPAPSPALPPAPPAAVSPTGTMQVTPPAALTPPVMKPEEPTYVTVEMTENGFKPAQVTIKKGTIVRFKNTGEGNMWPASNPHPAHTTYQDFDARRQVKPGETYEFRFKNVGSWGCHDHLSPGLMCRVVVTE